jgi:hypothetical protein
MMASSLRQAAAAIWPIKTVTISPSTGRQAGVKKLSAIGPMAESLRILSAVDPAQRLIGHYDRIYKPTD